MQKILICDDQDQVREVLSAFLRSKGYQVTETKTGSECLDLLQKQEFAAVFLDIKLPDLDGFSVAEEIKRLGLKTQTILMSGVFHSEKELGDKKGDSEFLAKPFEMEAVVNALHEKTRSSWKKLLVVDDQDPLRTLLKDFLSEKGYQITEVRNGKECVECLRHTEFDAIFMDVRMPEMDGIEALETLRKEGVRTPVILMSGYGDICSVEDAQKRGAQDFLPKPFKLKDALAMLEDEL